MENNKPKSMFQKGLENIETIDSNKLKEVNTILELILFKNKKMRKSKSAEKILGLYNILPTEHFLTVIDYLSGEDIYFPESQDFKSDLDLAICFYLKEHKGKSWKEIKAILKNTDLDTIALGIKIFQLKKFMIEKLEE